MDRSWNLCSITSACEVLDALAEARDARDKPGSGSKDLDSLRILAGAKGAEIEAELSDEALARKQGHGAFMVGN